MERYLAQKIMNWCGPYLNEGKENETIICYGIELILENLVKFFLIAGVGFLLGKGIETILCLIAFGSLRYFAGGSHRKTSWGCLFSMVGVCFVSICASLLWSGWGIGKVWLILWWVLDFILLLFFAPHISRVNPLKSKKIEKEKKIGSIFVLCGWGVLLFMVELEIKVIIIVALTIETLTILPKKSAEAVERGKNDGKKNT